MEILAATRTGTILFGVHKELYDGAIGDPETEVEKRLLGDLNLKSIRSQKLISSLMKRFRIIWIRI